jgi:nucleoredoxin
MSMLQVFPGVTSFKSNSSSGLVAAEVAFASADVVGLYFSGAWCVPCRRFTQVLTGTYNDVKARGKNMEVVFISEDEDEERMELYYGDMPWLALQWSDV